MNSSIKSICLASCDHHLMTLYSRTQQQPQLHRTKQEENSRTRTRLNRTAHPNSTFLCIRPPVDQIQYHVFMHGSGCSLLRRNDVFDDFLSHLHGQQPCEVDLGDGLGSLAAPLPHTPPPVFGQLRLLAGFHQVPQPHSSVLAVIQHRRLW